MSRYYLVARSDLAKEFQQPNGGGVDLLLLHESTKIGRNVAQGQGYRVPLQWQQVSGQHCRVFFDSNDGKWYIEDTSTNGTFVNGNRVRKREKTEIKLGDMIRLSSQPASGKQGVPEYEFMKKSGPHNEGDVSTDVSSAKRKGPPDYSIPKRPRFFGDGGCSSVFTTNPDCATDKQTSVDNSLLKTMSQLQKSNEELRGKLDASREQHGDAEQQLKASAAALAKALAEKEEAVNAAESKAQRAAVQCEALENQLQASKSACNTLESNFAEAKAMCAALSEEKRKYQETATKSQAECDRYKSQCEDLKRDLEMSVAEKEGAKQALAECRNRVSELVVKERQNASEKEHLEQEKARLQTDLDEKIASTKASDKILGQTVLKVEKEFMAMKAELTETKARSSQLEQDNAGLEEASRKHKRLGDIAVEEAKGARDKMAMMQAFIGNLAPLAKRLGAAVSEVDEMASEMLGRFEAARAPPCEDPSISETECGGHEHGGSALRKAIVTTPISNKSRHPMRDTIVLARQVSRAGDEGGGLENEGDGLTCDTLGVTRSPSQGTCAVDDGMDMDLEGEGQGATSNKTQATPRMSKRSENDVMQVKQTLTLSNGVRVSQTLDVERDEDGSSMPENNGAAGKSAEILEMTSVAEQALPTQVATNCENEVLTQPVTNGCPPARSELNQAVTQPVASVRRSQSGEGMERCEDLGQGSSPCLDAYELNLPNAATPAFGMDPTQETQAKNQTDRQGAGDDREGGEFEGME